MTLELNEVRSFPVCFDLVFQHQRSEPLMIEDFSGLTSVEAEMRVGEVHKGYDSYENEEPRVIALTLRLKWIIT